MFIKKDFSPIWSFDVDKLNGIANKVLQVISDYEKIEKCGLPFEVIDNSYNDNLSEIYMIKANQEFNS